MPAPRKSAKPKGRPRTKEPAGRERPIEQYDHKRSKVGQGYAQGNEAAYPRA